MPIVYACAASHAPGLTAWADAAPAEQKNKLYAGLKRCAMNSQPPNLM